MKISVASTGSVKEWLRQVVSALAASWNVEHTANGRHDWHEANIPYNALYFSGSSSTWGVDSDDLVSLWYGVLGGQMTLTFYVRTADVGASNAYLTLALPTGYRVMRYSFGGHAYKDAGAAWDFGQVVAVPDERIIRIYTRPATNWTSTTADDTSVVGSILIAVTKD